MTILPVTHVVLYKHGVGYFEREGTVQDDAELTLSFKQGEVSDVLKSLTVLDLDGGHITAVSYDSTKPLEQLLAEIAITIPDQGSLFGLVPQLQGASVRVEESNGTPLEGNLVGVDSVERVDGDRKVIEVRASLMTERGAICTFPLYESSLQLLDEALQRDLDFYLRTQLSAKKKDARTFRLYSSGHGSRRVRLSYVLEAPVWKATYRILLNEETTPMIQGWAVVDNTQDADWIDVNLSLVAGLPVSFMHDLYTPRYIKRPTVAVQETSGVLPPVVEAGVAFSAAAAPALAYDADDDYLRRGGSRAGSKQASAPSSMATQVRERQVGDLFEYQIEKPVTIRRNQSALVPIVLKPFEGRSVLLYQKSARPGNPMRCVEFQNTTGLTLEGGPITVLEQGSYVGEAMLDTLKPDEQRLVPYAVELSVRVTDTIDTHQETSMRTVIQKGVLQSFAAELAQTTYTFSNNSTKEHVVYVDHPRKNNTWELVDRTPLHETTDHYWRCRWTIAPKATTACVVTTRLPMVHRFQLLTTDDRTLQIWLSQQYFDPTTTQSLIEIMALRQGIAELQVREQALTNERNAIHDEQKRIRENLASLGERSTEKELRERYVRTLNTHEDRLEQAEREVKGVREERAKREAQMQSLLAGLEFEGTH